MSLVLDAGALLGIDRRDRRVGALLRVAQVWRHGARQAQLARTLAGVAVPSSNV